MILWSIHFGKPSLACPQAAYFEKPLMLMNKVLTTSTYLTTYYPPINLYLILEILWLIFFFSTWKCLVCIDDLNMQR